jgi:multisubunit Na+/H+ antiporter MnhE subunit
VPVSRRTAVVEFLVWWAGLVAVYLGSLTTVDLLELTAALVLGAGGAALAVAARRVAGDSWSLRPGWLRWIPVLAGAVVADTIRVLGLLARPRRLHRRTGDLREVPLAEPVEARAAVGGLVLSAAPGSYVVDVDLDRNRLVAHVLVDGRPDVARAVTGE